LYKILYPNQDVRKHQANIQNGYSGRTFDTKYVTPFLKSKNFVGAMKESGWLTRSLEQNLPYDLKYPGKINGKAIKESFLSILNDVEENNANPKEYLIALFAGSIIEKGKRAIVLINPIKKESSLSINEIINHLHKHFYYNYKSRGASILPVIALYSIYECIVGELKRFNGKLLEPLGSHNSCDKSSGATGDIVIKSINENELFEIVEVKFDIAPNKIMVLDVYKKIAQTNIQRYYILSTKHPKEDEFVEIQEIIATIREEHGCQIIVNGVFETIKYYLRLLENTDEFLNRYLYNLDKHSEINYEHKIAWNKILD
jgi:DNA (cytosine-5)-methyltransferase 1